MRRWLVAAALLAVAANAQAGFVGWVGVPLTSDEEDVEVPDVVGEVSSAAAEILLVADGLLLGDVSLLCSIVTANEVLSQSPTAGSFVALGSEVDVTVSTGVVCSLDGIPDGWFSVQNAIAQNAFVALMQVEATSGGGDWAYYVAGTTQGSANLRLDLVAIRVEATSGGADWARWAPGTQPGNTGNLQIHLRDALTADFQ